MPQRKVFVIAERKVSLTREGVKGQWRGVEERRKSFNDQ